MRRNRRSAFTLLELMTVVVIIMILAAMVMGVAGMARRAAHLKRCNAAIEIVATACEDYWSEYRDYPYPEPTVVGDGQTKMSEITEFKDRYFGHDEADTWDNEARNVTLVWMLSMPRDPRPHLNVIQFCLQGITLDNEKPMTGPDSRPLFRAIDGFKNPLRVTRPKQDYESRTYIQLLSAGPDGKFGEGSDEEYRDDNIERIIRR